MAECSAVGTTIDQAARAVITGVGGASSSRSHQVGALLGHASMLTTSTASAAAMALTSPDHLVMPSVPTTSIPVSARDHSNNCGSTESAAFLVGYNPSATRLTYQPHLQHHHQQPMVMQSVVAQQQQAMALMLHQQRQTMAMMLHQQESQIRERRQLEKSGIDATNSKAEQQQEDKVLSDNWHQDLDEEYIQHIEGSIGENRRLVVEELATAWAEAEAEYEIGRAHV